MAKEHQNKPQIRKSKLAHEAKLLSQNSHKPIVNALLPKHKKSQNIPYKAQLLEFAKHNHIQLDFFAIIIPQFDDNQNNLSNLWEE